MLNFLSFGKLLLVAFTVTHCIAQDGVDPVSLDKEAAPVPVDDVAVTEEANPGAVPEETAPVDVTEAPVDELSVTAVPETESSFSLQRQGKKDCPLFGKEIQYGDRCFVFGQREKLSFGEAKRWCEELGFYLLRNITKCVDDNWITNRIKEDKSCWSRSWWVGAAFDEKSQKFAWQPSESPLDFTNWLPGSPSNKNKSGYCVQYGEGSAQWVEERCSVKTNFICERSGRCECLEEEAIMIP